MNHEFSQLVKKLKDYEIDVQEFVSEIRQIDDHERLLLGEFDLQSERDDTGLLTRLIWAISFVPSPAFTASLCFLLQNRPSPSYMEAIVDAMHEIRDEDSVPCLAKVLTYYDPGDADFAFNRKVLWALERIGTTAAFETIEKALEDENELIRETALEMLERRFGAPP